MTLAELVTRVREKVDEDEAAFWSDTLIENQLNEGYRFYQAFIIKLFEGHFVKSANIDFDSNADGEYDLPSDYFKTMNLFRLLQTDKVPLRYKERYDNTISKTSDNSTFNLPTYRFKGNKIKFEPAPSFNETDAVEHEYARVLPILTDSVDVDNEFPALAEDCVVARAVVKCKAIEEMVGGGGAQGDPFIADVISTETMLREALEQRTRDRQYVEQFGIYDDEAIQSWSL